MRPPMYSDLADKALRLYMLTKDPLTFSAAKLLLKDTTPSTEGPQKTAADFIHRQLKAYEVLYTEPLV